jgi:hypothetical protein
MPHRASLPTAPAATADHPAPGSTDVQAARLQAVAPPSPTEAISPDTVRAPLPIHADDPREPALTSAAIPSPIVTPEMVAAMPDTPTNSLEAAFDAAPPPAPAIAQEAAMPSSADVSRPTVSPVPVPAPLSSHAPTTPDTAAHTPMPTPATPPARQEPPQPDAPLTSPVLSAPSLPDAATLPQQTQSASPIVEVRAARRPLSPIPAPPMAPVSPSQQPQPAPSLPALPRAADSPADAATPYQPERDATEPVATSREGTPVADMPSHVAESPLTPATASDVSDADDAALRLAALGRRLFGAAPEPVSSEPSPPPIATSAVPTSETPTLPTRGNPTTPTVTPPRSPEPEVYSAADLFLTSENDRSPQAWLARLTRAAAPAAAPQRPMPTETTPVSPIGSPAITEALPTQRATPSSTPVTARVAIPSVPPRPPVVPARPVTAAGRLPWTTTPAPPPMPLPESVRRFLAPVVGIDPAEVPIHRGAEAEAAVSAERADAITDGAEIALGAGHDTLESPQTLGLIAHELTHVARQRDPLFVPPILRPRATAPQTPPSLAIPAPGSSSSLPESTAMDEEEVAEHVEARVTRAVREHDPFVEQPRATGPQITETAATQRPNGDMPAIQAAPVSLPTTQDTWGDLPRPWEPLPAWLTDPNDDAAPATLPAPAPSAAPVAVMSAPAVMAAPAVAAAQVIQRAGEERDGGGETASEPAAVSAPDGARPAVEPDLDALSRQVYAILKRRLAAEQRSAR